MRFPITAFAVGLALFCATETFSQDKNHNSFIEDFNQPALINFSHITEGRGEAFTCKAGEKTRGDKEARVLSVRIDPNDPPGAGRGPEIISKEYTHYGTYAARIRIPDVRRKQPNVGAVVGYFTYHMDTVPGLSEIDFEWLLADPEIIYIGTWTGKRGELRRVGRTINLARGKIYSTSTRVGQNGNNQPLTGEQSEPARLTPMEGYDASARFYTYGFDWYPDRIRWWVINPQTADTVVLWNYRGSTLGIPQNRSRYRLNFWHTDSWPVESNPKSVKKPKHKFRTEVDWMSYTPWQPVAGEVLTKKD